MINPGDMLAPDAGPGFRIPYPSKVNADLAGARERNLSWAQRQGLLPTREAIRRYQLSGVAELAAFAFPDATGADLDLAFDVTAWFFLFDDQLEQPGRQYPAAAVDACHILIALLRDQNVEPPQTPAIVTAFADLLRRLNTGMSAPWRDRNARDWIEWLTACLTEVTGRRAGASRDFADCLALRRTSIGMRPSINLGECIGHFQLPDSARRSSHLQRMELAAIDNVIMVNEVYSLAKEEARGDVETNLVHCLMREHDGPRQDAIDKVIEMGNAAARRFADGDAALPALCDHLALPPEQCTAVDSYIAVLRYWMRGNYDWSRQAGRYSSDAIRHASPTLPGLLNFE